MPTIKLNTACICLGHLEHNAQSLQGKLARSQSESMYYCGHIIMNHNVPSKLPFSNLLRKFEGHTLHYFRVKLSAVFPCF